MSPPPGSRTGPTDRTANDADLRRRRFLALGAGTATALLAGCTGDGGLLPGEGTGSSGSDPALGTFRLLISDQPVAIDEFDELNVSLDRARVFVAGSDDDADEEDETETESPAPTESPTAMESPTATESPTETEEPEATETEEIDETEEPEETEDEEDFFVIDLEGATVDLTEVVGDKALEVFDGEFPAGRYSKIELYAADVGGIVEGEPVEVTIPSGKLQIVKPFEVVAGEELSFVFDINVVRKGQTGEYNLLPVISGSGVAGKDVEVEEVGSARAGGDDDEDEEDEPTESEDGDGGPPDDAGGDGQP